MTTNARPTTNQRLSQEDILIRRICMRCHQQDLRLGPFKGDESKLNISDSLKTSKSSSFPNIKYTDKSGTVHQEVWAAELQKPSPSITNCTSQGPQMETLSETFWAKNQTFYRETSQTQYKLGSSSHYINTKCPLFFKNSMLVHFEIFRI